MYTEYTNGFGTQTEYTETHAIVAIEGIYGFFTNHIPVQGQAITATIDSVSADIVAITPNAGEIKPYYADINKTSFWECHADDADGVVVVTYIGKGSTIPSGTLNEVHRLLNLLTNVSYTTFGDLPDPTTVIEGILYLAGGVHYYSSGTEWLPISGGTPNVKPSAPANLAESNKTTSAFRLSWDISTDSDGTVSGYNVYKDGVQYGSTTTNLYMDITSQTPGSNATWTVKAIDNLNALSNASVGLSVTTLYLTELFNNSSLDTTNFGSSVVTSGTVSETDKLRIAYAAPHAAAVWYKNQILTAEHKAYELKFNVTEATSGTGAVMVLRQTNGGLATAETYLNWASNNRLCVYCTQYIYNAVTYKCLRITYYQQSDGVRRFWSAAQNNWYDITGDPVTTNFDMINQITWGNDYYVKLESNGTQFRFIVYDGSHNVLVTTTWVNWSVVRNTTQETYLQMGLNISDNTAHTLTADYKKFEIQAI